MNSYCTGCFMIERRCWQSARRGPPERVADLQRDEWHICILQCFLNLFSDGISWVPFKCSLWVSFQLLWENTQDKEYKGRKVLIWLRVFEVSVYHWLAPSPVGFQWRRAWWQMEHGGAELPTLWYPGETKGLGIRHSLQSHVPVTAFSK